ncbi:MAG: 30S ribosomal protein S16 [Phycisphaerales bacterium]|nr:30S ribosomal protein S16 [Phycisphaerales bacterium]
MVRLRMQRFGRTHRPFFRLCAVDQRNRRNGAVIENLGWYNPVELDPEKQVQLNVERIQYWLGVGAQPSDTVADMLGHRNLLPPSYRAAWEKRRHRDRARVTARVSLKVAEESVAALGTLAGNAGADLSSFQSEAAEALKAVKDAVAASNVEAAEKAANRAKSAAERAQAAESAFQAKKKAEEAAAAPAEAPAAE